MKNSVCRLYAHVVRTLTYLYTIHKIDALALSPRALFVVWRIQMFAHVHIRRTHTYMTIRVIPVYKCTITHVTYYPWLRRACFSSSGAGHLRMHERLHSYTGGHGRQRRKSGIVTSTWCEHMLMLSDG